MEELTFREMESINAGGFIAGACVGITAGSFIYGVGLYTNWWNPVGWVSAAFLVADGACLAYGVANLN